MQTFLPYRSYRDSAQVLDRARLGKQRVEVKQILSTLLHGGGWVNHPAVKMWRGWEWSLSLYGQDICLEWLDRGYKDSVLNWIYDQRMHCKSPRCDPPWLGDEAFHASHRSNLLRKDPTHYSKFGWIEPLDLPYVWPVEASTARMIKCTSMS